MNFKKLISVLVLSLLFLTSCTSNIETTEDKTSTETEIVKDDTATVKNETEVLPMSQTVGIKPGYLATDFTTSKGDIENNSPIGEEINLESFRGKIVIINFWASWCGPCQAEIPEFNNYYKSLDEDTDVEIMGVNLIDGDNIEDVKAAINDYKIEYPIYYDNNSVAASIYKVRSIPTTLFIDKDGVIKEYIIGPLSEERLDNIVKSIRDQED